MDRSRRGARRVRRRALAGASREPAHGRCLCPGRGEEAEQGSGGEEGRALADQRRRRRPGGLGKSVPAALRALPEDRRHAADQVRRQRGDAACADPGRSALDRVANEGRRGHRPQDHVAGLCVRRGFPRGARPRLHARGPEVHPAPAGGAAARRLPELPCLDLSRLQEGGRWRHRQGLREDQCDALQRGGQARAAPGRLHRLPRRQDHEAPRHPSRLHRGHPRIQGFAGRPGLRREQAGDARGDARLRVRPVPRRVLLQGPREAARLPLVQGAQGRGDPGVLRRDRVPGLDPQGHRSARRSRPSTRSSSSGTRAFTPGPA